MLPVMYIMITGEIIGYKYSDVKNNVVEEFSPTLLNNVSSVQ